MQDIELPAKQLVELTNMWTRYASRKDAHDHPRTILVGRSHEAAPECEREPPSATGFHRESIMALRDAAERSGSGDPLAAKRGVSHRTP
jgi:hypothetical protein